ALIHSGCAVLSAEPPLVSPRAAAVAAARRHLRARRTRLDDADHYQVLEVSRHASAADVENAARALALRYAPDAQGAGDLGDLATVVAGLGEQIVNARSVLRDPRARMEYDAALAARRPVFENPDATAAEDAFQRGQRALAAGDVGRAVSE